MEKMSASNKTMAICRHKVPYAATDQPSMNKMTSTIDRRIAPRLLILSKLLFSMLVMSYYAEALSPITKNARMKKWNNLNNNNNNSNNNRRRKLQLETTDNSADDKSYQLLQKKFHNVTEEAAAAASAIAATSSTTKQAANKNNELCTPIEECELCPHKWKQLLEKDDEKIEGEYESCTKYGRRQQFECTVLFQGELSIIQRFFIKSLFFFVKKVDISQHYRI